MTEAYNPRRHGRTSELEPETDTLAEEWAYCHTLEAERGGTWVPTSAIYQRDDLQPRIEGGIDRDIAARYSEVFDDLPPVLVQRGTLVLIDGRHRLRAAYLANPQRYHMRVAELDVPDDELIDHAVRANVGHGRAATQKERLYWAKDFLRRHADWGNPRIAEWTGAGVTYVIEQRGAMQRRAEIVETKERLGRDGTVRTVTTPPPSPDRGDREDRTYTSPVEPGPDDDSAPTPIPYKGTRFPGGKPAGYFAVGSELTDLSTGAVVTLTEKGSEWATITYDDGESYNVHVSKDLRFAAVSAEATNPVAEAAAEPVRRERINAVVDALTGLANAIGEAHDAYEVAGAMELSLARYVHSFAEPALEWFAAFEEALQARVEGQG